MATEHPTKNWRSALAVCGFLVLAVALVFGWSITHDFVNFDDQLYVSDNPNVTGGLTLHGFAWAFTSSCAGNWHPITLLSHQLDCQLYGLNPWGHHLTNVLLHAVTAILLFLVLWRMTDAFWPSAFVAIVFAIHPLRVESVAWIAERKDVLSGLFFMLTLGAYLFYVRHPFSLVRYLMVLAAFALGLMSKPSLVTLPFVLLLLDYWPLGRMADRAGAKNLPDNAFPWHLFFEKIPLFLLSAASCAATPLAQGQAMMSLAKIPFSLRIENAMISYMAYLGKFFYPVDLAVFYPHPGSSLPLWKTAVAFLALIVISGAVLTWRRRIPYLFVGWFWYLGMLVPMIGLVQVGSHAMADRYTYLPQIGLCIAVTWGGVQVASLFSHGRLVCIAVSTVVLLNLMSTAWLQTIYWKDSETLWNHALECNPRNALAHCNLGNMLLRRAQNFENKSLRQRQINQAIVEYEASLEINPCYTDALYNLGIIGASRGQFDQAIEKFQKVLQINPNHDLAMHKLALVAANKDAAADDLRTRMKIHQAGSPLHETRSQQRE